MTHAKYLLSKEAEKDIRKIVRYTLENHGESQVEKYVTQLESCIINLSSGKGPHKKLVNIHVGLRYLHCQHHYIFGLFKPGKQMVIIAVLHERMEMIRHLQNRL
jgi:plasmid stabilization system protein ParE